ncbi:MAG: LysM peptidoglycan-binding domain-containing protein [Limisphaerales bacterium]
MEFWHRIILSACAASVGLLAAGCEPSAQSAADDEKEPHYVLGQNRVNAMDFSGAVEAFEASLEANPHSAKAHFQLAMLYENEKQINPSDPAAAIYHYQQYLRFDPKADNREVITQRIDACKSQLAANVQSLPSSSAAQQQLQQLADTNRLLRLQLDNYERQFAAMKTNPPATPVALFSPPTAPASETTPPRVATTAKSPATKPRTYIIAARDTPAAIARKYNISVSALLAANPGLNPKKLRVGQVIHLPSS